MLIIAIMLLCVLRYIRHIITIMNIISIIAIILAMVIIFFVCLQSFEAQPYRDCPTGYCKWFKRKRSPDDDSQQMTPSSASRKKSCTASNCFRMASLQCALLFPATSRPKTSRRTSRLPSMSPWCIRWQSITMLIFTMRKRVCVSWWNYYSQACQVLWHADMAPDWWKIPWRVDLLMAAGLDM